MKKILSGSLIAMVLVLTSCAAAVNPSVGAWNITMNTPVGAMPAVLTLGADGNGSMTADGLGEAPISGITYNGAAVNFTTSIDAQGQQLTLTFTGTVDGDALSGEFGSDFGAFGVTGTRQ
jgi:hypothetical protein